MDKRNSLDKRTQLFEKEIKTNPGKSESFYWQYAVLFRQGFFHKISSL